MHKRNQLIRERGALLVFLLVEQVDLHEEMQVDIDLGQDLLALLCGGIIHLHRRLSFADGRKERLDGFMANGVVLGDGLAEDLGGDFAAESWYRAEDAKCESGIEQGDGTFEQREVLLDFCIAQSTCISKQPFQRR